jgi:cytidine deaminase
MKSERCQNDSLLIQKARKAIKNAYAPYSGFKVGAAVLTDDGRIYTGCNVENASYGLTVCAERIAIFRAICDGKTKIEAVGVATEGDDEVYPCGACLQVMSEFGVKRVLLGNRDGFKEYRFSDLLPKAFKLK